MILDKLHQFKGQKLTDCCDRIEQICKNNGYSFNIEDPTFNKDGGIMATPKQVNCRTDGNNKILSFEVQ